MYCTALLSGRIIPGADITKDERKMRELRRSVAKGRMKALGLDRINRRMSHWKKFIDVGEYAEKGDAAVRVKNRLRKIRRVEK